MSAVVPLSPPASGHLLLGVGDDDRIIAIDQGQPVTLRRFHAQVRALAAELPARRQALNLCESRYGYLVALCAAALRGQVTLMPPSRAPAVVADMLARYPDAYALGDQALDAAPAGYLRLPAALPELEGAPPSVAADALAVIGFTSGSTGQPKPYPKTWGAFAASTAQNLQALRALWGTQPPVVVATVPPQHMFGLEMSVMLPLLAPLAVHAGRPFFPQDVADALATVAAPRLLVTTPVHLRTLLDAGIVLPPLAGMVSATAPLAAELAQAAEARFGGQMREVFGSTETCIFASRRTACEDAWTPLAGVRLAPQPDGTLVDAPQLPQPVVLADLMEIDGDGRFRVRGRQADLLEIAGKRASLGDLTRRLLAVPGVVDGVVLQLDEADDAGVRRIAALVVAPTLDEATLLGTLRRALDPVFLPRRIRFVDALPRAETGKLPRTELLALLDPR